MGQNLTTTSSSLNRKEILIVSDDSPFLFSLSSTLRVEGGISTCKESGRAPDFRLINNNVQALLLDPDCFSNYSSYLTFVSNMRSNGFDGSLCFFSESNSAQWILEAALVGADWCLSKCCPKPVFFISVILAPQKYINRHAATTLGHAGFFYLSSLGLDDKSIQLCELWIYHFFPEIKEFAYQLEINDSALFKRFNRMRQKLNISSLYRLSCLLTALATLNKRLKDQSVFQIFSSFSQAGNVDDMVKYQAFDRSFIGKK